MPAEQPMLSSPMYAARRAAESAHRATEALDGLGDERSVWTTAEVADCLERAEAELMGALWRVQALRAVKPQDLLDRPWYHQP